MTGGAQPAACGTRRYAARASVRTFARGRDHRRWRGSRSGSAHPARTMHARRSGRRWRSRDHHRLRRARWRVLHERRPRVVPNRPCSSGSLRGICGHAECPALLVGN
jgi:hypothetical protein